MMTIQFKKATLKDLSNVLDLMRRFNEIDHYPFDEISRSNNITALIQNPNLGLLYLIQSSEKTIGYIALTFGFSFEYGGRDAFIDEFFISEDFRNQGIGTKTMKFIELEALKYRVNALHLEVEDQNERGLALYLKQGFRGNSRKLLSKKLG